MAGCSRNPSPGTHTRTAHPSQEWRGTSGARTQTHTNPSAPARSGGAQPTPEPKHTHPHRTPKPEVVGYKRSARTNMHNPSPQPGVAGRSQNPSPCTPTHFAHPSQEWRVTSGARTQTRTPQHPRQERRGPAKTRAQAHTPTQHTPTRSGGVQAERTDKHTHTPTSLPGMAGRSRNPSRSTHAHTAHQSQKLRGAGETRAQANTPTQHTPARSDGVQAECAHQPTRTPTTQSGVAGRSRNPSRSRHTHIARPSQEWWGAAETRAQAHTPTPHTQARSGGVQAEQAHKHTHTPTPQPVEVGPSQNPSPSTHAHTAHPSQGWRGTSEARTQGHTHPNIPARSGGAQLKPEPEHTHPQRTPQPGVAGYKRSAHTSTHIPQHPSQEWRGAAETGAQAHTPTPHTQARSGGAQPKPEPRHTHPRSTPQPGVAGYGAECAHKPTKTPTPQSGVAGRSRNPSPSTHTHIARPSQEWWGAAETRAQAHTPTPHTQARSGGVQAEQAHKHTHTPTPQPVEVGPSQNPSPSTHAHTAHPSQGWRGTSEARTQGHTHPNIPARSGGAQLKPEPEHTHPQRTPQPGVAGYKRSAHTSTHIPQHPSQEWRGAAETGAQAHPPTPHTQARSGGAQPKPEPRHTHPRSTPQPGVAGYGAECAHKPTKTPTPQSGVAGRSRNPSPSTHTHIARPSQEWWDAAETRAQAHTPTQHTAARAGGVQAERAHKDTHTPTSLPEVAGRS